MKRLRKYNMPNCSHVIWIWLLMSSTQGLMLESMARNSDSKLIEYIFLDSIIQGKILFFIVFLKKHYN